ncbi:MAG: hypothetical protein PHO37_08815, partial [Kiritimatiellae bacterium]|nr:hypothetical protein [Kiritimatiellia bacterium]
QAKGSRWKSMEVDGSRPQTLSKPTGCNKRATPAVTARGYSASRVQEMRSRVICKPQAARDASAGRLSGRSCRARAVTAPPNESVVFRRSKTLSKLPGTGNKRATPAVTARPGCFINSLFFAAGVEILAT